VQHADCETLFCHECIKDWLARDQSCPVDRKPLTLNKLKSPPRIAKTLLGNLELRCDFSSRGCDKMLKLEHIRDHEDECAFNPKFDTEYVKFLRAKIAEKDEEIRRLRAQKGEQITEDITIRAGTTFGDLEQEEIRMLRSINDRPRKVHPNITCDGCDEQVCGYRYKCLECRDFDLCARCEMAGLHSEHLMMRIPSPSRRIPEQFGVLGATSRS